jgi:type IV pilus assembly protein PilY1
MKALAQLFTSTTALALMLAHATVQATSVAELPLKASVLAKPNVVFAMDDSGSMDAEVMIDGNFQGWVYFSYNNTTQYPSGARRTGSVTGDVNMFYLFPNGTGTGNKVYGNPSAGYGFAIPPLPEYAWTRSVDYNTLYYDSAKTYVPWSPGYASGTSYTFSNADPAAARSHPVLGSTTVTLNADLNATAAEWRFTFLAGQTVPSNATNVACFFASFPGTLPYTVTTSRGLCQADVPYYPATFWKKESCVANGTSCVTNYDGQTLKRYEIKNGNTFPSGRSYTDEMQNFANWFTYYRKRRLMLGAAMGQVLENITGLRMGVVAFNANSAPTMYDADSTTASSNRLAVIGRFYTNEGPGGTPTHTTMGYVHDQFDTNTGIIQYACQRNAQFVITDGFANDTATAPPTYTSATWGSGAPYTAITSNSLHDKALGHFTYRLRATTSPLPAGRVPLPPNAGSNPDQNPDLHLNTYALTLGMKGTVWPNAVDPFVTAPTWPAPVSNTATMIDDLWHATINGRGKMYLATDVSGTVAGIQAGLTDIMSQNAAQSGVAVSTVNLVRGDSRAYYGTYNPAGWSGDVSAYSIDAGTGAVGATSLWSASALLTARSWSTRLIASATGSGGVAFTEAAVGSLVNPSGAYGVTSQVIDYLRGDRSREGTSFRTRTGLMGAVMNSEPYVSAEDGVLFVASGEGMLHAIETKGASAGQELWAFVPRVVLPDIGATVTRSYAFKTQLDGSPVVARLSGGTKLLVAGLGAAGRGYYALDVSNPRPASETALAAQVKWEFPASGDATTQSKVGQTLGRSVITRTATDGDVVLVTSGYNSTYDGKGRLWLLNASTGAVIHEFTVAAGTLAAESGLTHVSAFVESDGKAQYAYGGDLLGNVWRFDLKNKTTPDKVAVLTGPTGTAQSVTAPPELTMIENQRVVVVVTGRLLDASDFGNTSVQSVYAIADGSTLTTPRTSLVPQTYVKATDTLTGATVDWSTQRGWFMDLPAGEHGNTRPTIAYGGIAFVTNVNGGSDCAASSNFYLINVKTGGKMKDSTFVSSPISTTANATAATVVVARDGMRALVQDFDNKKPAPKPWPKQTILPGKEGWREVRP